MTQLFSLEGKTALVTGGAYGIGFAIAEALASAGANIAFNCRSQANLDKALAGYAAKGIDAHGYIADVTDEAQVTELIAKIETELGGVDILVNNAGIIKRIPMTEMITLMMDSCWGTLSWVLRWLRRRRRGLRTFPMCC